MYKQSPLATKADLLNLKSELSSMLNAANVLGIPSKKEFIKSREACEILECSYPTLVSLRTNRIINPKKVGGTWYYPVSEIYKVLKKGNPVL